MLVMTKKLKTVKERGKKLCHPLIYIMSTRLYMRITPGPLRVGILARIVFLQNFLLDIIQESMDQR